MPLGALRNTTIGLLNISIVTVPSSISDGPTAKKIDWVRTVVAIQGAKGKRLTYKCLPTGIGYQ